MLRWKYSGVGIRSPDFAPREIPAAEEDMEMEVAFVTEAAEILVAPALLRKLVFTTPADHAVKPQFEERVASRGEFGDVRRSSAELPYWAEPL